MKTSLIAVLLLITVTSFAQTLERQPPRLSVQHAITRAAKYVTDRKIDVSKHFVSAVRYIESGTWTNSSIGKGPYWQVTYELVKRTDGGQHFILIYMDGKTGDIGGL
jgi:hypothetical protein